MHCSDDELLAYLDGEISGMRGLSVGRHLKSCWHCRTRLAQCEEQIHRLSVAVEEDPFPASEWVREGRRRLHAGMSEVELGMAASRGGGGGIWKWMAAAVGALAVCAVSWVAWTQRGAPAMGAPEVLARVADGEQRLFARPVHQAFEVEIAEVEPARRAVTAELDIWSDGPGGRYVSRLRGRGGTLKQALWRPGAGSEYVYLPASAGRRTRLAGGQEEGEGLTSLGEQGVDPAQLEAAFLRWLETRAWRPISLAAPISVWAGRDGTVARAEQIRLAGGEKAVRITVERRSARLAAVLTLEVDAQTYRPRLQRVRYEQRGRVVEFSLKATAARAVEPGEVAAAVERQEPGMAAAQTAPAAVAEPVRSVPGPAALALAPEEAEALSQEVSAHYLLHLAGACLGEPVRVASEAGTAQVFKLNGEPAGRGGEAVPGVRLDSVMAVLSDMRAESERGGQSTEGEEEPLWMALRHARAMERLSARFPAGRSLAMPEESRALLESMVRDHAATVRQQMEAGGLVVAVRPARGERAVSWQAAASELFGALSRPVEEGTAAESGARAMSALEHVERALARRKQ